MARPPHYPLHVPTPEILNLRTGTIAHWLRLDGTLITELYDSVVLPGVRLPMAVGFQSGEIEQFVLIDNE